MTEASKAPAEKVYGYNVLGDPIKLPASSTDELVRMGGRLATAEEVANMRLREQRANESTAEKVFSASSLVAPVPQALGIVDPLQVKALQRSIFQGATAGLGAGLLRQGADAVGAPGAASEIERSFKDYETAFPKTSAYGEMAGMVGGMLAGTSEAGVGARGLARALPSSLIGRAGAAAEGLAARALPEATSVAGRAGVAAAKYGAQGAAEGALFNVSKQLGDDLLEDKEVLASKLGIALGLGALGGAAGGVALGSLGSLGMSGLKGLRRAAGGEVADAAGSLVARSRGGADEFTAGAASRLDQAVAAEKAAGPGFVERALANVNDEAAMDGARVAAWRALQAPEKVSKHIGKRLMPLEGLPGGQAGAGEVLLRHEVLERGAGAMGEAAAGGGITGKVLSALPGDALKTIEAMRVNTPELLHGRAVSAQVRVGQELGEALSKFDGAQVPVSKIENAVLSAVADLRKSPSHKGVVREADRFLEGLMQELAPLNTPDGMVRTRVPIKELIEQRRLLDNHNFASLADPGPRLEVMQRVGTNLRNLIKDEIDRVAGETGQEAVAKQIRMLNRDYMVLSAAERATEVSAARHARNSVVSLRGAMSGGGSLIKGFAHSLLLDRGQAGIAATLANLADAGAVSRTAKSIDDLISRSARGAVTPTAKGATRATMSPQATVERANLIMDKVREAQLNPEGFLRKARTSADPIGRWSPTLADALVSTHVRTLGALAARLPKKDIDPMNPDAPMKLSDSEARRVVNLARYADEPKYIFQDIEKGVIDADGIAVADEIFPQAMAQLRMNMVEEIQRRTANGNPPTFQDALRIGVILRAPTLPVLRPRNLSRIQAMMVGETMATNGKDATPRGQNQKVNIPSYTNYLDRIEEKKRR
jgi:hypothetical protein